MFSRVIQKFLKITKLWQKTEPWQRFRFEVWHQQRECSLPMSMHLCLAVCCLECQYFQCLSWSSLVLSSANTTIITLWKKRGKDEKNKQTKTWKKNRKKAREYTLLLYMRHYSIPGILLPSRKADNSTFWVINRDDQNCSPNQNSRISFQVLHHLYTSADTTS